MDARYNMTHFWLFVAFFVLYRHSGWYNLEWELSSKIKKSKTGVVRLHGVS